VRWARRRGETYLLEPSDSIVVLNWERKSWRGEVHMSQVLGDDQSVIPYQCSSGG
jgi:hypothetical protein